VLDVVADLIQQHHEVLIVQAVAHHLPLTPREYELQMPQNPQLLRNGGRRKPRLPGKLPDATLTPAQRIQQPHPRRRRKRLHRLRNRIPKPLIQRPTRTQLGMNMTPRHPQDSIHAELCRYKEDEKSNRYTSKC